MSDDVVHTLTNPPYRIGGSFAIVTAMDVRRWWGLRHGRARLTLPKIPDDAFEGEAIVGAPGAAIQTAIVSIGFLTSETGRTFFEHYLRALPRFVTDHEVAIDHGLLLECLAWSLQLTITDPSAPSGMRHLETFETLGLQQFEHTVTALRASRTPDTPPLVVRSDEMSGDTMHLALAEIMEVGHRSVTLDFAEEADDEDGSGDELRFVQHRVTLEREPFASAMAEVLASLRTLMHGVCGALGMEYAAVIQAGAASRGTHTASLQPTHRL